MYIPGELFIKNDAAATAANLAAHESLFRFGILTDVLAGTLGLLVGLALYQLFKDVDKRLATLMVILGALMVTPIYYLNTLNDAAALWFATDAPISPRSPTLSATRWPTCSCACTASVWR